MAGGVEHHPEAPEVTAMRLGFGLRRPAFDGPRDTRGALVHPDVEMELHARPPGRAGPHRTLVVLFVLDLDLVAAIRGTQPRPTRFRRFDLPAEKPLVEGGQRRHVGRVEYGTRHAHPRPLHR